VKYANIRGVSTGAKIVKEVKYANIIEKDACVKIVGGMVFVYTRR
jgi:hypothetical protein